MLLSSLYNLEEFAPPRPPLPEGMGGPPARPPGPPKEPTLVLQDPAAEIFSRPNKGLIMVRFYNVTHKKINEHINKIWVVD